RPRDPPQRRPHRERCPQRAPGPTTGPALVKALQRKLLREFRQLRGQALAIAAVMVAGIATLVMAQGNHAALSDTRDRYYADYRFADVFASARRAPLALGEAVRAIPDVAGADLRVGGFATLEVAGFDEAVSGQIVSLPGPGDAGLNRVFLREGALPAADHEVVLGEAFANAHGLRPG